MIRCPICKKEVTEGTPDFPFCSERCRTIDLGNWAMEKYKVSSPAPPPGSSEDEDE
jgi:endogenous inhibitor of DNA gyrase (YacG/DUF329 family)